jgi:hypothetical protein
MPDTRHPAVIVHNAAHVRLVLDAAGRLDVAPVLLTPPGAAAYAGVAYLKALVGRAPGLDAIVDCGHEAGFAMAAIRAGWRDIHLAGDPDIVAKIDDMANRIGGRLHRTLPPALDLGGPDRPETRLDAWLTT